MREADDPRIDPVFCYRADTGPVRIPGARNGEKTAISGSPMESVELTTSGLCMVYSIHKTGC